MADPTQKVAILTGAGTGIGRALAVLMGEAGYAVVLAARTKADLEETARQVRDKVGDDAATLVVPTDVTDDRAVQKLVDAALDKFGRIDAVANVAGNAPHQPIPEIEMDTLHKTLATNLGSVVSMTRALWPVFEKQKGGVICNVSSMASVDPFPGLNIYGAAKAAVNLFTKATASEGKDLGIEAYCVAPGPVETAMMRSIFTTDMVPEDQAMTPAYLAAVIRDTLTGKRQSDLGETIQVPGKREG